MFTKFGHVLQAFGLVAMEAQLRNIPVDPWAANGRYFKRLRVYPFFFPAVCVCVWRLVGFKEGEFSS